MKTDQQVQRDVMNELRWEPSVIETHIGVSVNGGVVTLNGHVPSYGERSGAETAVKRVLGVRAIANELVVKLASDRTRNDEDIATACVNALRAHGAVPDDKIQVVVHGGWITIEGTVEWQYQRAAAGQALHNLIGIQGIANQIEVMPHASARKIKDDIEAALVRSAEIDAAHITVETTGDKVILRGQVRSLAEKNEAQHAAWSAPGVSEVENEILVAP